LRRSELCAVNAAKPALRVGRATLRTSKHGAIVAEGTGRI
jgi:hypothetical protein